MKQQAGKTTNLTKDINKDIPKRLLDKINKLNSFYNLSTRLEILNGSKKETKQLMYEQIDKTIDNIYNSIDVLKYEDLDTETFIEEVTKELQKLITKSYEAD